MEGISRRAREMMEADASQALKDLNV